ELATSVVQRADFRAALAANRPWISDRIVEPHLPATVLIAVPLSHPPTPPRVLVAAIRPNSLATALAQHRLPEGASASVRDRQNAVVVELPATGPDRATPLKDELMKRQGRAWEGSARLPATSGETVYVGFTRSSTSNWTVMLVLPEAAFNAPWR